MLKTQGSKWTWYAKPMRSSSLRNEALTTVLTKAVQRTLTPLTSPGYPLILNLLLSPVACFVEPLHLFLGWALLCSFLGALLPRLAIGWWGFFCAGTSSVLCAEEVEGVPAAVNYVCCTGSWDHSSQIYLARVGSCFLLMQKNKNIIITKVRLNDSLK